jgi:hypothetical protein
MYSILVDMTMKIPQIIFWGFGCYCTLFWEVFALQRAMVYICMYQNEVLDYVGIGGWISTLAKVMHLSKFSKLALSKVIGY